MGKRGECACGRRLGPECYACKDEGDKTKMAKCWRCGKEADGAFGGAILVLHYADASFGGTFRLPLCYECMMLPHNQGLLRL